MLHFCSIDLILLFPFAARVIKLTPGITGKIFFPSNVSLLDFY